jgi:hypothetical protein
MMRRTIAGDVRLLVSGMPIQYRPPFSSLLPLSIEMRLRFVSERRTSGEWFVASLLAYEQRAKRVAIL